MNKSTLNWNWKEDYKSYEKEMIFLDTGTVSRSTYTSHWAIIDESYMDSYTYYEVIQFPNENRYFQIIFYQKPSKNYKERICSLEPVLRSFKPIPNKG